MREMLSQLSPEILATASTHICVALLRSEVWIQAQRVLLYAPIQSEIDVAPLIDQGLQAKKQLFLPRFDPGAATYIPARVEEALQNLPRGRFGVPEPRTAAATVPANQLDLIVVPGLAFDMSGHRLGRGKGFYDRLLETVRGAKAGVALDQQVRDRLPVEPHDAVMNVILTPTRWLQCDQGVV